MLHGLLQRISTCVSHRTDVLTNALSTLVCAWDADATSNGFLTRLDFKGCGIVDLGLDSMVP